MTFSLGDTSELSDFKTFSSGKASQHPTLEAAYEAAAQALDELRQDPEFEALLVRRHMGLDDVERAGYWMAVADFAKQRSQELRAMGVPESDVAMRELFAATPAYIYGQNFLDRDRGHGGDRKFDDRAKYNASYYNRLIRQAARQWPDMTASGLLTKLLEVVDKQVGKRRLREVAMDYLDDTIWGAQNESGFRHILEHTGREIHESRTDEDVQGFDFIAKRPDRPGVDYIDSKASMHDIIQLRHDDSLPFARRGDTWVIYTMLSRDELDDSFTIPDDVARDRARTINEILDGHYNHGHFPHGHHH